MIHKRKSFLDAYVVSCGNDELVTCLASYKMARGAGGAHITLSPVIRVLTWDIGDTDLIASPCRAEKGFELGSVHLSEECSSHGAMRKGPHHALLLKLFALGK